MSDDVLRDDATSPPAWRLRLLDGAARGRTLRLPAGLSAIGSDGGCALMIADEGVQPRHAQFDVGSLALTVQRVGQAEVSLNGKPLAEGRRSLAVGDRLRLGKVEMTIEREIEPATASAAAAIADDDEAFLDGPGDLPPPARPMPIDARLFARRAWPIFTVAFVLAVGMLGWGLGIGAGHATRLAADDPARLRQVLADYPETQLVSLDDGRMQVTGFVESRLRGQALASALAPAAHVSVNVQSVDAIVERARGFLGDPGVAVTYAGKGLLLLSGATDSAVTREKARRLAEDLHPAVLVSDKVAYKADDGKSDAAQALWSNWQSLLPARVVSITDDGEGRRHIELANGQRYYEGALLKSGAQLKLVSPNELVIEPEARP